MATEKTHYRKAFNSPYLSAADIVEYLDVTISQVKFEADKTKKTKDSFNTAYFVEREIRSGETLKPMILNATNSKSLANMAGTPFIDDWSGIYVRIYVDHNVRFGRETVEGLRITSAEKIKPVVTPANVKLWSNAKAAYLRDGHLNAVKERVTISIENEKALIDEVNAESSKE